MDEKPHQNPSYAEWAAVIIIGIFAVAVLIACWWMVDDLMRIGPP